VAILVILVLSVLLLAYDYFDHDAFAKQMKRILSLLPQWCQEKINKYFLRAWQMQKES